MGLPSHGLEQVAELFPSKCSGKAFLAHCAVSPLPYPVAKAITTQVEGAMTGDSPEARARELQVLRDRAAALIHAHPDEIAFVGNTVEGVIKVAAGMRWSPGDNVVGGAIEFPANVYPWMGLRRRDVELRLVEARQGRITVAAVREALDHRTRLVALSSVQFLSGHRTDLSRIGELCRERGIRLFVDAIQGLGALRFDVRSLHVDYMSTGGHKWMLGPIGTGVFYCRRDAAADLTVPFPGHRSMVPRPDHLPYAYNVRREAARFEVGAMSALGVVGLSTSIDLLLRVGIERIEPRVLALAALLLDGLHRRGCEVLSPEGKDERSGIVAFRCPSMDAPRLAARLEQAGVVVTTVSGWTRAAPHFYNDEDDIERLLAALP